MSSLLDLLASGRPSIDSTRVTLNPSPGFTIKSVTTEAGLYSYAPTPKPGSSTPQRSSKSLLEPEQADSPKPLQIPKGVKVFLNIAWDKNVPPPPPADEEAIRRAILAEDVVESIGDGAYFVPAIVSEPREDRDKAGKPSIVFDCIFNSSLKSRCTKDVEFKMYLIALALEQVELKTHVSLSREIGTPNIASKGKLEPREVLIPNSLLKKHNERESGTKSPAKEAENIKTRGNSVPTSEIRPKSILKSSNTKTEIPGREIKRPLIEEISSSQSVVKAEMTLDDETISRYTKSLPPPRWKWKEEGDKIVVEIETPKLNRDSHTDSILDIENRRVLLFIPNVYFLDINLNLTEAQIGKIETLNPDEPEGSDRTARNVEILRIRGENAGETLRLKRARPFHVESAKAEWYLSEGKIVLSL